MTLHSRQQKRALLKFVHSIEMERPSLFLFYFAKGLIFPLSIKLFCETRVRRIFYQSSFTFVSNSCCKGVRALACQAENWSDGLKSGQLPFLHLLLLLLSYLVKETVLNQFRLGSVEVYLCLGCAGGKKGSTELRKGK